MTLGQFLKKARENAGLTQKQVADKLGYSSAQFISNFENDRASLPLGVAKKFCKITKANEYALAGYLKDLYWVDIQKALGI